MGSHLDTAGMEDVHYIVTEDRTLDAAGAIAVEYADGPVPRRMAVTATARLPRLVGKVKAKFHRTGVRADGKTTVSDWRWIPVTAETVVATDDAIVPLPQVVAADAIAGTPIAANPRKRRKVDRRAAQIVAWKTQFSFKIDPSEYKASDRAIVMRAGGDVSALYHTGFRVFVYFAFRVGTKKFKMCFDLYVRAPVSMPFSPVACPVRGRDAIREFVGKSVIAGRETEAALCAVPVSLLRDMSRSGDPVHADIAGLLFSYAIFGFVTGETPVVMVPLHSEIFRLPQIQRLTVAEVFVALSLLSQLPLGFTLRNRSREPERLPGYHWAQMYSTGAIAVHTKGPPAFCLGPRLELRPNFGHAVDPRSTTRYWCSPRFAPGLPALRQKLTRFSRALQLNWAPDPVAAPVC